MKPLFPKPIPLLLWILALLFGGIVARCYRHSPKVPSVEAGANTGL